ncbi:hypothetical protein [Planococcus salinarum]|uniref:hypothetical protein n=1 Tax=Planococcus salinarum TaxID=622695 RepID=UPI000E3CE328|nr:hypothetical protein [Planococcus salinarum]TAA72565.1 hypothetical protein D2909_05185 [Planococcus salinarum]
MNNSQDSTWIEFFTFVPFLLPLIPLLIGLLILIFVFRAVRRMERRAEERLELDRQNNLLQQEQTKKWMNLINDSLALSLCLKKWSRKKGAMKPNRLHGS